MADELNTVMTTTLPTYRFFERSKLN